jgi:hypothetical protein
MNTINEKNGQTIKEFGDLLALLLDEDSGLDIERAIIAMAPNKARVLEKQISALYKKLYDLTNQGFGLREGNSVRKDQDDIRHFTSTVKQFKDMFDDLAGGEDTNAYDSPVRQGFDVHPTRDKDNTSPHWDKEYEDEKTQNENHIPAFNIFESKDSDALAKGINKEIIKIDDSMSYKDFALAVGKILRDEYGKHNFDSFMKVLHKDLGM